MSFFARPNLDDIQFKQVSGSTLTLSGNTLISEEGSLAIQDKYTHQYVPIEIYDATNYDVLTYEDGKLILKPFNPSGTSTGIYTGRTPSICSVGGLPAGTTLTGRTIGDILQEILAPVVCPTLTPPSHTFVLTNCIPTTSTGFYEIGTCICVTGLTTFNQGCINPTYGGSCDKRSGLPAYYCYSNWGVESKVYSSSLSNTFCFTPRKISNTVESVSTRVFYNCANWEVRKSDGSIWYPAPSFPSGCTTPITRTINGTYPYFYGKIPSGGSPAGVNRPTSTTICSCIIAGCGKVVCPSNGTICINFNSTSDDYLWFATPAASTTKTCWYINELNKGCIGGAVSAGGNLFPDPVSVANITTTCWSNQTYKIYISNYQTAVNTIMELRNS